METGLAGLRPPPAIAKASAGLRQEARRSFSEGCPPKQQAKEGCWDVRDSGDIQHHPFARRDCKIGVPGPFVPGNCHPMSVTVFITAHTSAVASRLASPKNPTPIGVL